jgi:double zinc ribbon protein
VTDLERFFRRLVANLAGSDPARLHHPLPLDDVQHSIVPYRSNRRALHLETSEDYELVLLRLCAGEGNLVRTEPEEARARFAEELQSPNPDLDVLRKVEHVVISLRSEPLARALDPEPDPDLPYAPPSTAAPPAPPIPGLDLPQLDAIEPLDDLEQEPIPEEPVANGPHCLYCGDRLPPDRPVRFCPHCGQRQSPPECPHCHSEVEPGWRHCVSCGAALAER